MARPKYSVACYYGGKMMGRCTTADGETYKVLMEQCGNDAARVMREYAYFSPELKAILDKVSAAQAKSRPAPIYNPFGEPLNSPWGEVQTCDKLCTGVYLVSTASHGGTMVARDMEGFLSPAAKRCGLRSGGFLCFEEDCDEAVAMRELLDKGLWQIPDRIKDKTAYEDNINKSLQRYHPEYWGSRERGRSQAAHRRPAPSHAVANR